MRLWLLSLVLALAACGDGQEALRPDPTEALQGGQGTTRLVADTNAFSHVVGHAGDSDELNFKVGNGIFRKIWVAAPASTAASDGLGPHFDARGCQACHIKDGRGNRGAGAFVDDTHVIALLASGPSPSDAQLASTHPQFGHQFQRRAIVGHKAEGQARLDYIDTPVMLADGLIVTLKRPNLVLSADIGAGYFTSRRVANPVFGLGLIAAISDEDILANVRLDSPDPDGVSGRAHWVTLGDGSTRLGRFGWKAESPSLDHQIAKAFSLDMGLSSGARPAPFGDCTAVQIPCRAGPHGDRDSFDSHEVSQTMLALVRAYVETLAVPVRRNHAAQGVLQGKAIFHDIGCASCHTPKYETRENADNPLNSSQTIWPYSDFLLHDMGRDLSDSPTAENTLAHEWRTPPLWGLGLTKTVNPNAGFLHDGRAETILEAVLWHGGEAQPARDRVQALEPTDREALLAFLESL